MEGETIINIGGIAMEQVFLTGVEIKKVRHLKDISIPLDKEKRKHLILTGKNGSGKTSVLEALVQFFVYVTSEGYYSKEDVNNKYKKSAAKLDSLKKQKNSEEKFVQINVAEDSINVWKKDFEIWNNSAIANVNSISFLQNKFKQGEFIFAYYKDTRKFQVEEYRNIEKIQFQDKYSITDNPGTKLTKYLVDLKATQAFTKDNRKSEKIDKWFHKFEDILKMIFDDDGLKLNFNDETFQFSICESGRETFDFNTMSRGYAAVLDIINDLIIRMEAKSGLRAEFDMEGIVLVDEIETHLHLELQKKILPILTTLFPNIQFIITTHSPFILSSLDNAVIYDLENKTLVENGLKNLPYEGIVEGYFEVDKLSEELRGKFERYKKLVSKAELSDEEYAELDKLEFYLDEIPDYLAKDLTAEYSRLKLEFSKRG